jgi:hypothetical protein
MKIKVVKKGTAKVKKILDCPYIVDAPEQVEK